MNKDKAKILDKDEMRELSDSLENLISGMGTERDKRSHSTFTNDVRLSASGNQNVLNAMYRTDWLSGKVVDIIPDDMTREWRRFTGDLHPSIIKRIVAEEERLDLRGTFNEVHKWARLYGTAFIIMSIDDGQDSDKPVNLDAIKLGGLRHIKVIDRHRVSHAETIITNNPLNSNFGLPEFYRIAETSVKIHNSRVIRFDGVKLPWDELKRQNFFSDSVLDRLYEPAINLNTVSNAAATLVHEANVDIVKIKGLMGYLQTAEGEELIRKRFGLAKVLKSINNMMLLDAEEDYDIKSNSFSGLPELLDRYALLSTAAADVPATRLLGSSASGLNATGEGDLKNYYDKISSDQNNNYRPKLNIFDKIMFKSLGIDHNEDSSYEFNSLFQMTPKEKADIQLTESQRDTAYLDQGVVDEGIVAKELKEKGTYTNITDEHIEELEETENGFEPEGDISIRLNEEEKEKDEESEGSEDS